MGELRLQASPPPKRDVVLMMMKSRILLRKYMLTHRVIRCNQINNAHARTVRKPLAGKVEERDEEVRGN